MTRSFFATALAAAFGTMLTLAPSAQAQVSYPLICRGGGVMQAAVRAGGQLTVRFAPGAQAGSLGAPGPGTCTWLDRGFRDGEPAQLFLAGGDPAGALYLLGGILRGEVFYAHVYNTGSGSMRVTRVGP